MLKPDQGPGHGGMLANQVPKAAITALRGLTCCGCDKCLAKAIAAALNAWPGMWPYRYHDNGERAIILPIAQKQEDGDD